MPRKRRRQRRRRTVRRFDELDVDQLLRVGIDDVTFPTPEPMDAPAPVEPPDAMMPPPVDLAPPEWPEIGDINAGDGPEKGSS